MYWKHFEIRKNSCIYALLAGPNSLEAFIGKIAKKGRRIEKAITELKSESGAGSGGKPSTLSNICGWPLFLEGE